jgi:DNA-binding NarL/FixJ family response regulator
VLDVQLPPSWTDEGIRADVELRATNPTVGVLVLSQYPVPEYATQLLQTGPHHVGYLLKDRIMEPVQLTDAVRRVHQGGTVIDPTLIGALLTVQHRNDPIQLLTNRQREVLDLMAQGLSDQGIADRLYVSLHTVDTHRQQIFRRLDLPDTPADNRRVQAVLVYLQHR